MIYFKLTKTKERNKIRPTHSIIALPQCHGAPQNSSCNRVTEINYYRYEKYKIFGLEENLENIKKKKSKSNCGKWKIYN